MLDEVHVMALLGCQTALHPSLEWSAPSSPFRDERWWMHGSWSALGFHAKRPWQKVQKMQISKCPIGGRHQTRAESSQVQKTRNLDRQIDSHGTRATRTVADHAVKLSESAPSAAILPILRRNPQCPCIPKVAQKVKELPFFNTKQKLKMGNLSSFKCASYNHWTSINYDRLWETVTNDHGTYGKLSSCGWLQCISHFPLQTRLSGWSCQLQRGCGEFVADWSQLIT